MGEQGIDVIHLLGVPDINLFFKCGKEQNSSNVCELETTMEYQGCRTFSIFV